MSIDFKKANENLARNAIGICKKYLPRGTQKGDWWLAPVPWRVDKNPSLGVNLTSGRYTDFGRPGDRGDMCDLIAKLTSRTAADVARENGG